MKWSPPWFFGMEWFDLLVWLRGCNNISFLFGMWKWDNCQSQFIAAVVTSCQLSFATTFTMVSEREVHVVEDLGRIDRWLWQWMTMTRLRHDISTDEGLNSHLTWKWRSRRLHICVEEEWPCALDCHPKIFLCRDDHILLPSSVIICLFESISPPM